MLRVFLDSSVLIAAAGSRNGASGAVMQLAEVGLFKVLVSRYVLTESERNLRKKLPRGLSIFAEILSLMVLEVLEDPSPEACNVWKPIIEPKDTPVVAAAVAGKATVLLSLNTKDFTADAGNKAGMLLLTPAQFLQQLRPIIESGFTPQS